MVDDDFTDKEIIDGDEDVDFFDSCDDADNDANDADDGSYRLSQLLSSDNKPTGLVGEFLGQLVRVRGVPSPSGQKGVLFSLTDFSAGLCASCGFLHGSGRSLPIIGAHGTSKPSYFQSYVVEGVLEFGENKQLQINVS